VPASEAHVRLVTAIEADAVPTAPDHPRVCGEAGRGATCRGARLITCHERARRDLKPMPSADPLPKPGHRSSSASCRIRRAQTAQAVR